MKKIAIAAAVAFVAFCSQAASVNWTYTSSGNTENGNSIYMIIGSAPDSITDMSDWLGDQTVASSGTLKYNALKKISTATVESTDAAITKDKSYYFIMFDAAGENYKVTGSYAGTDVVYDTAAQETAIQTGLETAFGDWKAVGGTIEPDQPGTGDVPEPTSGLLLVLGAAGLALRRRRA